MTNDELSQKLAGYRLKMLFALEDKIAWLERENTILRSELKERLIEQWIVNYEMSEEATEQAAEQYIVHMVAHNEGAEFNRDDIIRMAREAGFETDSDDVWITDGYWAEELERFALLIRKQINKDYVEWKRQDRKEKRERYAREKAAREGK